MNFDCAFDLLIGHEGGYVNHASDPGGETKFGVSKRSYPNEDIKNLTLDRAKEIYQVDYWEAAGCEHVPDSVKFDLFDMAVNSGIPRAIKTLQEAALAEVDGVLGPMTIQAVRVMDADLLRARFNGVRLRFMADLPTWPAFGRGWARRIADNLLRL